MKPIRKSQGEQISFGTEGGCCLESWDTVWVAGEEHFRIAQDTVGCLGEEATVGKGREIADLERTKKRKPEL